MFSRAKTVPAATGIGAARCRIVKYLSNKHPSGRTMADWRLNLMRICLARGCFKSLRTEIQNALLHTPSNIPSALGRCQDQWLHSEKLGAGCPAKGSSCVSAPWQAPGAGVAGAPPQEGLPWGPGQFQGPQQMWFLWPKTRVPRSRNRVDDVVKIVLS